MSILIQIEDMDVPNNCLECPILMCDRDAGEMWCCLARVLPNSELFDEDTDWPEKTRPGWCPIKEDPEHGRLIDADLLVPDSDYDDGEFWAVSIRQIEDAQTVIERNTNI